MVVPKQTLKKLGNWQIISRVLAMRERSQDGEVVHCCTERVKLPFGFLKSGLAEERRWRKGRGDIGFWE